MATEQEKRAIGKLYPKIVVDLGAHRGEEFSWLQPLRRYAMVEPDVENAQHILDAFHPLPEEFTLVIGAIAAFDGRVIFNGSYSPSDGVRGSGSIRKPTEHLNHFPGIQFPECRRSSVPCFTLDTLYRREHLECVDLLWVDIQGAERDMIAGGADALSRTHYLFMEAEPEVRMYDGQFLKDELLALLPNWRLIGDFGYNVLLENKYFA